jgi:DnaK suppressor protein
VDAAALRRHRKRLNDLRDEIVNEGDLTIEPGRTDPTAVGTDEDEQPLAEMSQTIASSRNRARASELTRIQAALNRLENDPDSFGLCAECDEPISPKRLELMPFVDLCVECQQAKDGPKQPSGRRHLRDYK